MSKHLLTYSAAIFILTGCSIYQIDSQDISSRIYSPKASIEEVQYVENAVRPHEVIGYITVTAERSQDRNEVLKQFRKEAMALGGDAVTDISVKAPDGWEKLPAKNFLANAYIRAQYRATVIAYEQPGF